MTEPSRSDSIGASIKRLFIAFLISNFMAPVGIWLGIEYIKLAGRFGAIGLEKNNAPLTRAAKYFKALVVFCFASAAMYVVNMAVVYPVLYGPLMYFAEHHSPALLGTVVAALGLVFTLVIVSMVITAVISRLARLAWENIFENFKGEPDSMERTSGSFQIARIIKGAT